MEFKQIFNTEDNPMRNGVVKAASIFALVVGLSTSAAINLANKLASLPDAEKIIKDIQRGHLTMQEYRDLLSLSVSGEYGSLIIPNIDMEKGMYILFSKTDDQNSGIGIAPTENGDGRLFWIDGSDAKPDEVIGMMQSNGIIVDTKRSVSSKTYVNGSDLNEDRYNMGTVRDEEYEVICNEISSQNIAVVPDSYRSLSVSQTAAVEIDGQVFGDQKYVTQKFDKNEAMTSHSENGDMNSPLLTACGFEQ